MDAALVFRRSAATVNKAVLPLLDTGVGRRLFSRSLAVLTYRGRRSGREIAVPVSYRREGSGGDVVIGVLAPDAKTWWRNFTGEGAPVQLRIGGQDRSGHAVALRDGGSVTVRVTLD